MQAQNVPINKGNYSMETIEREILFEKYRGEGWEEEYRTYRSNWIQFAKNQCISEYPLSVDLELSSICNLKCPMCFTITEQFKEKVNTKLMDLNLYKKIIDEIAGKIPAIRLSFRGEPTLHPKLIECIRYAKTKGIGEVSFLTNGSKLDEDYFEELLLAGIDWITISVDGMDEIYENIRKPIKFNDILENIKNIKKIKESHGKNRPVIKIQTVWPAIRNNIEEFYNTFVNYVDLIAFNPLIDYLGNDKEEDIVFEKNFSCPQLYQRVFIGADGLAMMCSNDEEGTEIIGDANKESIYDIWHGCKLSIIRETHKIENGFKKIPVCRRCYLPRLTEDREVAYLNDRKIIIKNYVNRKQQIGY